MTRKPYPQKTPAQSGPRVNEAIRESKVRLVDEEGEMIGVVAIQEALDRARTAGLDLIEISPNSEPPVCKLMDYGKFKYQEQKRLATARKKQKIIEVKEVKIRPAIEENDYQVKLKAMRRFLEEGDKAKITMRFRGREIANQELAMKLMHRILADVDDVGKVELAPKMEGRQMIMILVAK